MSNSNGWRRAEIIQDILLCTAAPLITYFLFRRLLNYSQAPPENKEVSRKLEGILADRSREQEDDEDAPIFQLPPLTSYEQSIASEVVHPSEIPVAFADIGGLDDIISDLQESVIYPLTMPNLYSASSPLLSAPSGVLLYGPPGCGKTMLAKALAHESGAVFINLHISTLTDKWYGDSNKLASAVFTLAKKLAPSIVFIDEIDAVFGTRRTGEHEASGMVKAEFMARWDGLTSSETGTRDPQRILILGATNRIHDIDDAILRRMPKRFAVSLPDAEQRRKIFKLILKETKIDRSVDANGNKRTFDLDYLVKVSVGMSGSDIKEACREAAMVPVREYLHKRRARGESIKGAQPQDLRGLRTEDFFSSAGSKRFSRKSSDKSAEPEDDDEYVTTDSESGDGERGSASRSTES